MSRIDADRHSWVLPLQLLQAALLPRFHTLHRTLLPAARQPSMAFSGRLSFRLVPYMSFGQTVAIADPGYL